MLYFSRRDRTADRSSSMKLAPDVVACGSEARVSASAEELDDVADGLSSETREGGSVRCFASFV